MFVREWFSERRMNMGDFKEFDLDLNVGEDSSTEPNAVTSSNPCWAASTYVSASLINGGCKTVTNDACRCEGISISSPCGSAGYRIK
jgi:hypothetical protein